MKKLIFILAIFFQVSFLFSEQFDGKIEVINDEDYFPRVLKAIQQAKKSIYLCVYYIAVSNQGNIKALLDAVIEAHKRGVEVEIILDQGYDRGDTNVSKENLKALSFLKKNNIPVFYDNKERLTHSKFIVIDDRISIVGSVNWTNTALGKNREATLLVESPGVAQKYQKDFKAISKFTPQIVEGAIPIPREFMENRKLASQMVSSSDSMIMKFYLWVQKLSYENKSSEVKITADELNNYFYKDDPVKFGKCDVIQYFMKHHLCKYIKRYSFLKSYKRDEVSKTLNIELSAENKPELDSLYISPLFWQDGWDKRLSEKAIFCYFYVLDKTESGRMGRYFEEFKWDAVDEYHVGHAIFAYGTGELQRYNLIEKDIQYRPGEENPNAFILNEFYVYEDFQASLDKLKAETEPELFKTVQGIADYVNESSDLEHIKELISLGKKYGLKVMQDSLVEMKKRTNSVSPYKRYGYVKAMIKNKGEGK